MDRVFQGPKTAEGSARIGPALKHGPVHERGDRESVDTFAELTAAWRATLREAPKRCAEASAQSQSEPEGSQNQGWI
jgi:hypothetical protein